MMSNLPPTRRGLLAGAAAFSAAGASGAVPALAAGSEADAELIRLCHQFHQQHAEMEAFPGNRWDELGNAAIEAQADICELIEDMPAMTNSGLRAKASVAVVLLVEYGDGPELALATLRDVAGRA